MRTEFDSSKRDRTLTERGLDFARAGEVFAGRHLTRRDARLVVMVWTPRGEVRRIISMRKANEREIKAVGTALG